MERIGGQPPTIEKFRHFDPAASVDLMRFDLTTNGSIRPETRQRVYDEELTFVAEGIDRRLETTFVLKEMNGQFMYFSEGKWQPYQAMLTNGIKSAQYEASLDPRKQFLVEMASDDYLVAQGWNKLKPGEKMNWYSPFRDRELALYGEKFMNELGFSSKRRMGFLYQAEKDPEGNLILTSNSVDNSDEEAFDAAMLVAEKGGNAVDAYDQFMSQKYGQKFNAGRLRGEEENAWDVITRQKDLVKYYMTNLETLARNFYVGREDLENDKKRLTYGFWAAIKERMDREVHGLMGNEAIGGRSQSLSDEVAAAYSRLQAKGEILFGCGGSISPEDALLTADPEKVFDSIFGKLNRDELGSLTFTCKRGHVNKRKPGKQNLRTTCVTCLSSVGC